ncbi:MAG: PHP domain-containing protein [Desulforhopalus sp.]|nr:PHP domain-containing protein [Desulforhopalus sp.]
MTIDLHVHSTFSDGSMSPTELVYYAKSKRLSAIAITDHDTIDGIGEAISAGTQSGVEIVPGVELSVKHEDDSVHLLGYFFKQSDEALLLTLKRIQSDRVERNRTILANMEKFGVDIQLEQLEKVSGHGQSGRPHIAQLLIQRGVVRNMDEAFDRYLGKGGLAYAQRAVLQADEAIKLICDAGGIAVLAHPQQVEKSGKDVDRLIGKLRAVGLGGIEVYYPTHSRQFKKKLLTTAKKLDLLVTGGSDYHGSIRPGTTLAGGKNCSVPLNLLAEMKHRLENSQYPSRQGL